jgi:queuine tRNA-ribosyltransferase
MTHPPPSTESGYKIRPVSSPPPLPDLAFRVEAREGRARAGAFDTPHGRVRTPAFMPVATRASLKGLTTDHVIDLDPEVVLANTYHLHLRPGERLIRDLGGLHGFTGLDRPWITDSGGYQVFSLGNLTRVREDGVLLKSHLDGAPVFLGPKEAIGIQESLGADLVMAFDHCLGLPASQEALAEAVARTTRWTQACVDARTRDDQALFGIVQGGTDPALRARSAEAIVRLELPGYAIGGLAVGETREAREATLRETTPCLPEDRPRYLMGVGMPTEILDGIAQGVDLFDCVLPTRLGRHGHLFTNDGIVRIAAREHERSESPLDPDCGCEVCRKTSRAYLRHLFSVGEQAATTLGTLHNVTFYLKLVRRARDAIVRGAFDAFRETFTGRYEAGEARWRTRTAADPHGAEGSRRAREEQQRRTREFERRGKPPAGEA